MFEIHIADKEMSGGSVCLTWCLSKDLIEKVKATQNTTFVVIVVVPTQNEYYNNKSELRWAVPLTQGMEYIHFRRPGKNKIYAFLIHEDKYNLTKVRYLHKFDKEFDTDIIAFNGQYSEQIVGWTGSNTIFHEGEALAVANQLEVEVPEALFAKEPPQWEKDWVLWLLSDKGVDQCAFRKRRIFAYMPFLQPLIFLLNWSLRLGITIFSLLLGMRGFTLRFLLHPLRYDLGDICSYDGSEEGVCGLMEGGSIFIRPTPEKFKKKSPVGFKEDASLFIQKCWALPFLPPIFAILVAFTYYHLWLKIVLMLCVAIPMAIFLISLNYRVFDSLFSWLKVKVEASDNNIEELICTGEIKKPKNKSIKLRFQEIKGKVCKPFAR